MYDILSGGSSGVSIFCISPEHTEWKIWINHISICLNTLGPHLTWRDCPPRASQFLDIAKDLPASMPFICISTNPELTLPNYLTNYQTLTDWYIRPHSHSYAPPNHSRTRYKTAQDNRYNPAPAEIIPTGQSQTLPCLFLSTEMIIKYLSTPSPCFPSASWPTPVLPHVALHGMSGLLLLKTCVYKNVFLQDSHIRVCASYLKTIPEYIFKQVLNNVGLAYLHHFQFLVPLYS